MITPTQLRQDAGQWNAEHPGYTRGRIHISLRAAADRIEELETALTQWRDNYENTKPAVGGCGWVAVPLHQLEALLQKP